MKKRKLLRSILVFILLFSQILFPVKRIWAEEIEPTVTYHKTITPMRDSNGNTIPDQYELMLDITTNSGQNITYQPLDVVFVADLSGSMGDKISEQEKVVRIDALKKALNGSNNQPGLIDLLLSNPNNKNRVSLVGFAGRADNDPHLWNGGYTEPKDPGDKPRVHGFLSGIRQYDDAYTYSNWTTDKIALKDVVSRIQLASYESWGNEPLNTIGTNTNVEAGLRNAIELLKKARGNAKRIVILLSD